MFQFQQFTVQDDRCAMKVGTDGVLLGAWAQLPASGFCLDVGCGSGLIALILAQRFPGQRITALDIDGAAVRQAQENVAASPFAHRISVVGGDFLTDNSLPVVQDIVCNPPFFQETLLAPDMRRAQARHTAAGMSFSALLQRSVELLPDEGSLQVVLPKTVQTDFHLLASDLGLSLVRAMEVRTVARKPPKRVLLHFRKAVLEMPPQFDQLVLMEGGRRTPAYAHLCRALYLTP